MNQSGLGRKDWAIALTLCAVHVTVAVVYHELLGVSIEDNLGHRSWDWWWQLVPADLLRSDLWRSLWFLHSQPPLYNLYGAFFFRMFPADPLSTMQLANILIGGLIPPMAYLTLRLLALSTLPAGLTGLYFTFDPGLFLFEAYLLYDLLTAFLVTSGVYLLALYWRTEQTRYGILFIMSLCVLVLTRSAYQLLIVPVGVILAALTVPRRSAGIWVLGLAFMLLPVGWYAKNYVLHGIFASSSWMGFNLWKASALTYSREELASLAQAGVISKMTAEQRVPWQKPSVYQGYGFDRKSSIPVLSRDDRHNINMVAVSAEYQRAALRLIGYAPDRYLRAVTQAYYIYCIPAAQFRHLEPNAERISINVWIYSRILQGGALADRVPVPLGSLFSLLIPTAAVVYLATIVTTMRSMRCGPVAAMRRFPIETWILFLTVYTTLVSVCFEVGENNRERFYIELALVVYLVSAAAQWASVRRRQLGEHWARVAVRKR